MSTAQEPINSGFGASSTASDVVGGLDLSGRVAIVTGGYSGIGLETTRVLRSAGSEVIVPARDLGKAENAVKDLNGVEIEPMDLLDPASVDAFAETFLASGRALHMLVDSAGIMASPLRRDMRGYESQFATNHLGHFQLAMRLWPALRQAQGSRVVSVSSRGHHFSDVVFDDPNFQHRDYDRWLAYGQSKTANILFALELDERGRSDGVRAFSLHPGGILNTGLAEFLSDDDLREFGAVDDRGNFLLDPDRDLKTVEQGAATSVWCATSPQLEGMGGLYCEDCDIAPLSAEDQAGGPATDQTHRTWSMPSPGVMAYAVDLQAAGRLWRLSEQLTGSAMP